VVQISWNAGVGPIRCSFVLWYVVCVFLRVIWHPFLSECVREKGGWKERERKGEREGGGEREL
jgi:membrane protein implicated in regulation of membrane protease activity